jgi:hypothetical protein
VEVEFRQTTTDIDKIRLDAIDVGAATLLPSPRFNDPSNATRLSCSRLRRRRLWIAQFRAEDQSGWRFDLAAPSTSGSAISSVNGQLPCPIKEVTPSVQRLRRERKGSSPLALSLQTHTQEQNRTNPLAPCPFPSSRRLP